MRENRTYGSEGGEASPSRPLSTASSQKPEARSQKATTAAEPASLYCELTRCASSNASSWRTRSRVSAEIASACRI